MIEESRGEEDKKLSYHQPPGTWEELGNPGPTKHQHLGTGKPRSYQPPGNRETRVLVPTTWLWLHNHE